MKPADRVLAEEAEWDVITDELAPGRALISVSRYVGDSRVYRSSNWVIKMRRLGAGDQAGVRPLKDEASMLRRVGRRAEAGITGEWEFLRTPYLPGQQLSAILDREGRSFRPIASTAVAVLNLNRQGIAHGDVRAENILVADDGTVTLVDFDRARLLTPGRAMLRDWLGPGSEGGHSLGRLAMYAALPQAQSVARRARALTRRTKLTTEDDQVSSALTRAWWVAAKSNANAPGQRVAYYAWTFRGRHFVGERPWAFRWELVRNAVSFAGKRILELGSNMALASSHALIHGASEATAVDSDERILDAAALVGVALGVPTRTVRMPFERSHDWESVLPDADLAIAMSILEWVPDRARFERYLGRFPELVFEGHESLTAEGDRLARIGFRDVRLLGLTDRGRPLFLARH